MTGGGCALGIIFLSASRIVTDDARLPKGRHGVSG